MRVQRCKGSRDLSPQEMERFRLIEGAFRDCCLKAGYEEVRTPTVEYLHLFTATGTLTPSRLNRVYSFLDWDGWSGERVVLRPDGTIPIARLYVDSMENKGPAKLFYVTSVFVFEPTGTKAREQWQCGAELIGAGSALADVELIALAREVLKRLHLEGVELRLSHVGLIRALLTELGLSRTEQIKIFDRIMDGDVEALTKMKPRRPELGKALSALLDLKGKSSGFLHNSRTLFKRDLPGLEPYIDDLIKVVGLLDTLGYDYQIDIASGAGFEYYTGMTFQLFLGDEKIGGGGRYDALVPLLGGRSVPASGFALYLERLMGLAGPARRPQATEQRLLVTAEPGEAEAFRQSFAAIGYLRDAGYVAELNLGTQGLADFRWLLEVQGKPPQFVVTDQVRQARFELSTTTELLALLRRESAC